MNKEEVREIASKLTKAQRAALLGRRDLYGGGGFWPLLHALQGKGLVQHGYRDLSALTPLGLAVKAHLLSEQSS